MKSKYFIFNEKEKEFKSKRKAKTKKEMWEKALEKWGWIMDGYDVRGGFHTETCGCCDYYNGDCDECILTYINRKDGKYGTKNRTCIPHSNNPDLQYLWLLFVYQAVMGEK